MTDAAAHEKRDDTLRPGLEVRLLYGLCVGGAFACEQSILVEQGHETQPADSAARLEKKIASGPELLQRITSDIQTRSDSAARARSRPDCAASGIREPSRAPDRSDFC